MVVQRLSDTQVVNTTMITARSLLHGFLELRRLTPELGDWTEERLSDNPPRLFRLRQLIALFRGFGIPWDPPAFVEGRFIDPEQPRYAALLSKLTAEMLQGSDRWGAAHQLPEFFAILYDYRERLEKVLSFSSGVLEASGLYLHAHHKAGELNRVIRDNIAIIDDNLAALISPEDATFSVEQLARDYAYPNVDLFEIDADWW
jgi:hypothetical protein